MNSKIFSTIALGAAIILPLSACSSSDDTTNDVKNTVTQKASDAKDKVTKDASQQKNDTSKTTDTEKAKETVKDASNELTGEAANAAKSAKNYLSISAFSHDGLINQLSSDAGDKFPKDAATKAVDSLKVDWNEQAKKAAENYQELSPMSCDGMIQQLSSGADKFTKEQATYGAHHAKGVCS